MTFKEQLNSFSAVKFPLMLAIVCIHVQTNPAQMTFDYFYVKFWSEAVGRIGVPLFFFISGYLFKKSYLDNLIIFFKKRVKSLILPYYLYNTFYLLITILIAKFSGKFWGLEVSLKNFFLTPFLNGHQFDLSCPLWFVPQLFISLCSFAILCCCFKKLL